MPAQKTSAKPHKAVLTMTPQLDAAGSAQIMQMVRTNQPSASKIKRLQGLAMKAQAALIKAR